MFEHFFTAFAAHAAYEELKRAFDYVARVRPDLAHKARTAEYEGNINNLESVFREAVGVIVAAAGNGKINIDRATITALNWAKFDHQNGRIVIENTIVSAPVLVTGGNPGAKGVTNIGGNTSLRSQGTQIDVGQGCGITITGGANITQS